MKNNWKETTLGEIAEKVAMGPFGSNIKVETFVDSGVPIVSGDHLRGLKLKDNHYNFISDEHAKRLKNSLVKRGDVIFTHAGNIGQVAYIPNNSKYETYIISQRQFFLRCDAEQAIPEYITYFFKTRIGQYKLLANANQVGVPSIARPTTYLKSITLSLPPLDEQKKIAGILGSLDDKIELLRKENETLEKLAQTLFRKYFRESTSGIPVLAEDLIEFNPRESIDSSKEYLFFDMKCLSESSIAISDGIMRKTGSATHFRENDTLMAKITPCLENGKTGFVFDLHGNDVARGSTEFIVMRAKEGADPYFTYCLARDDNFRDYAIKAMTGTSGRQRVRVDLLKKYQIYFKSGSMVIFGEICDPIFEKMKNNISQMRTLTALRDSLLPKLMSGDIKQK
jgi:type I restriction enzyme, S subunit